MDYRWNIYLVNIDPVIGSEQGKTRPAYPTKLTAKFLYVRILPGFFER